MSSLSASPITRAASHATRGWWSTCISTPRSDPVTSVIIDPVTAGRKAHAGRVARPAAGVVRPDEGHHAGT
ncbi:hypothetical protein GCM10027186_29900 [Micromonospora schwarzwaldensis]